MWIFLLNVVCAAAGLTAYLLGEGWPFLLWLSGCNAGVAAMVAAHMGSR